MIRGHFDGASRGNPGAAGAGMVIYDGERVIWRRALPLGMKTNNEAEYMALSLLLDELERRGLKNAEICGDSKLVISQVTGQWKIKEPRLKALAGPIIERARALQAHCRWVPRERNAEADRLSNVALDKGEFIESVPSDPREPIPEKHADISAAAQGLPAGKSDDPELRRVGAKIWLVKENGEEFAVDMAHRCCTCEDGRKNGRCRHIERVLMEEPFVL